jgi:DNA repair exonuclease SbcCD nuclease subunit
MRAILVADTHFDKHSNYPGKAESDIESYLKMYQYAVSNNIGIVFHLGDLFDKNSKVDASIYGPVYDIIDRYCDEYDIPTVLIPGNHDVYNKKNFNHSLLRPFGVPFDAIDSKKLRIFPGVDRNMVAWEPIVIRINNCHIALIPYSDNRLDTLTAIKAAGKVDYVFGHFGVNGISEHIDGLDLVDTPSRYKHMFLGHYHKYVDKDGVNFIGAFTQRNFGEEGNPVGFTVLDIDSKVKPVYNQMPIDTLKTFKTYGISDKNDLDKIRGMQKGGKFNQYFVRIKYGEDFKKVTRNFDKELDFTNEKRPKVIYDIDSKMSDMLKDYVDKTCQLKNPDKVYSRGIDIVRECDNI